MLKDEIRGRMKPRHKQAAMALLKNGLSQLGDEEKTKILDWFGLSIKDLDKFSNGR